MNKQHEHGATIQFEPKNRAEFDQRKRERAKKLLRNRIIAGTLAVASLVGIADRVTQNESTTPLEINNASWITVAEFDDYGEGGRSVFIDTVTEMRPDLKAYKIDEAGDAIYDGSQTKVNIESEFHVSINSEGGKIQKLAGGDEAQHGAEVMFEYDGNEFHYSTLDG